MHVVVGLVVAAIIAGIAYSLLATFLVFIVLPLGALGLLIWGITEYVKHQRLEAQAEERALQIRQERFELREQTLKLHEAATLQLESRDDLYGKLGDEVVKARKERGIKPRKLPKELIYAVLSVYYDELDRYPPPPEVPELTDAVAERYFQNELAPYVERARRFDRELLQRPLADVVLAYMELVPEGTTGQLQIPLYKTPVARQVLLRICDLFWDKEIAERDYFPAMRDLQRQGAAIAQERLGAKDLVWAKDYPGDDGYKLYLPTDFAPVFEALVPFSISDSSRFAHHWCLGKTGRGKTTFLRHLIRDDLRRASEGECSLVVVDSKKLIREMRGLKDFAPGQPLHERVTVIDSDDVFPLNPFHLPKQQARAVLVYMLAGLSGPSELQSGALTFFVDAALQTPNPTLQTILDLVRLDARKGQLPEHFSSFDKETRDWFEYTRKTLHPGTSGGIEQRLANFLNEHKYGLARAFNAPGWALDFQKLHDGGHVLLVDTDLATNGKDGTNLLGRLMIALVEQLSTGRNRLDEKKLKPLWLYLDEASDYIEADEKFVQILIKARSSRIGATVAYQYRGLVDPRVEKALENAEIQSECKEKGHVDLQIAEKPITLPVARLEFTDLPQMNRLDYIAVRARMRRGWPKSAMPEPSMFRAAEAPAAGFNPEADAE